MIVWGILFFVGLIVITLIGFFWMIRRYFALWGAKDKGKWTKGIQAGLFLLLSAACVKWRMVALVTLHLLVFFVLVELAAVPLRRAKIRKGSGWLLAGKIYRSGLVPLLMTGLLLGYGYYNMQHIVKTEYTVASDKLSGDYKVILITDTHYGTIQSPSVLQGIINDINLLEADIVILGGDIVEEGTSKEAMEEAFAVLGGIESNYGIYYVYGNHDRQPYTKERAYTEAELEQAIEENGIEILSDRVIKINDDLVLAGREDLGRSVGRSSVEDLLGGVDENAFLIVADHQPVEALENAKWGVDLEVSGHTHAGQVFPAGWFNEITGMNYGTYQVGECTVIVSSGATGWGFPIRTQEHCEYVVISLEAE